jgi:hypothetical protein
LSGYSYEAQPGIRGFSASNLWRMREFSLDRLFFLVVSTPAMVAEYQTQMPDKKLLQAKLHEFYQQLAPSEEDVA